MSDASTSRGSRRSAAASISPQFSRSSGGIQSRPRAAYTSSSVAAATRSFVSSLNRPYSLSVSPILNALCRSGTL